MRGSARPVNWQPARSWGGMIGLGLSALAAVGVGGLAAAAILTSSASTRLLAALLELPLLVVLATCVLGTWRWFTLVYALAPTALEIRSGTGRLRIRYEDVTRVILLESSAGPGSSLWPGAPAGDERLAPGRVARWWGTTQAAASRVLVETSGGALLLTPTRPQAFAEAILGNRRALLGSSISASARRGWLDLVANVDPWFRVLAALALAVTVIGMVVEVIETGGASRHTSIAAGGLLANIVLASLVVRRSPNAARVAMAATLALQCLAVVI